MRLLGLLLTCELALSSNAAGAQAEASPGKKMGLGAAGDVAGEAEVAAGEGERSSSWASLGIDTSSAYYFRGILQNTEGVNLQPFVEVGFPLYEGDAVELGLGLGIWSSFQPGNLAPRDARAPRSWYEADFYPSLWLGLGDFGVALRYTAYTSPNGSFATVHELSLGLSYDDSGMYADALGERFGGIQPSITLAREVDGTAVGDEEGTYLEIAIGPSCSIVEQESFALGLSLPISVGLSLGDYFELPDPGGGGAEDDTLGAFSFGAALAAGLGFVPERLGAWTLSAGVDVLLLGENLQLANRGESLAIVGEGGLSIEF